MVGFAPVETQPKQSQTCVHAGFFQFDKLGQLLMRTCTNCGTAWYVVKLEDDNDRLAWDRIIEPEECEDVAGMGKALLDVPGDEGEQQLLQESSTSRWTR